MTQPENAEYFRVTAENSDFDRYLFTLKKDCYTHIPPIICVLIKGGVTHEQDECSIG